MWYLLTNKLVLCKLLDHGGGHDVYTRSNMQGKIIFWVVLFVLL